MTIHVVCSGCLKRFKVHQRFAGMETPCPSCEGIIAIPKSSLIIHGDETHTIHSAKTNSPKGHGLPISTSPIASPVIARKALEFDPVWTKYGLLGAAGIAILAFLVGCISMGAGLRSVLGVFGLGSIAFPLVLLGYHLLRDQDRIIVLSGEELYRRAGIVAAGYVGLWIAFEYVLAVTTAGAFIACLYLAIFAILATLLVLPLLELQLRDACLHFSLFALPVIVLRYLLGLGWFWQATDFVRGTAAPPFPV